MRSLLLKRVYGPDSTSKTFPQNWTHLLGNQYAIQCLFVLGGTSIRNLPVDHCTFLCRHLHLVPDPGIAPGIPGKHLDRLHFEIFYWMNPVSICFKHSRVESLFFIPAPVEGPIAIHTRFLPETRAHRRLVSLPGLPTAFA